MVNAKQAEMHMHSSVLRNLAGLQWEPIKHPHDYREQLKRRVDEATLGVSGTVISDRTSGSIRVAIAGEAKYARLAPTAKAVHNGDTVKLQKQGGQWVITENLTWREPPKVGAAPPSGNIPAAATSSGSTSFSPRAVNSIQYLSSYPGSVTGWGDILAGRWNSDLMNFVGSVNSAISSLRSRVDSMQNTVNTNAGRLNTTRDIATGTRDATTGLRDGALQDGVVQP